MNATDFVSAISSQYPDFERLLSGFNQSPRLLHVSFGPSSGLPDRALMPHRLEATEGLSEPLAVTLHVLTGEATPPPLKSFVGAPIALRRPRRGRTRAARDRLAGTPARRRWPVFAPRIHLHRRAPDARPARDASITLADGNITQSSTGRHRILSGGLEAMPGGGNALDVPDMPVSSMATDEQFVFKARSRRASQDLSHAVVDDAGEVRAHGNTGLDGTRAAVMKDSVIRKIRSKLEQGGKKT